MTDPQIIREIAEGNQRAFTELYNMYRAEFIGYVRKSFRGGDDTIIDLYQDACVALYENIIKGRLTVEQLTHASLKTYLFCIGRNKLVDMYRSREFKQRRDFIENIDYIHDKLPWQEEEPSEREVVIRQAVAKMTEPCNTILLKFYWEQKSMQEIAQECGYNNPDSAKTQKSKCMTKLKVYITKQLQRDESGEYR